MDLQPLPAFEDNYIWVLRDMDGRALIVDPGDAAPVLDALEGAPEPHAVLLTHHHGDHVGGVPELLRRWPRLPVFAPNDALITTATHRVKTGDMLEIGHWRFRVLEIPGHTRSHVAYVGEGLLFCGDTLFALGCGRLFEGTPAQMLDSLRALAALPADTLVCCGHEYTLANAAFALTADPGNLALQQHAMHVHALRAAGLPSLPGTLAIEHACNPFLRCEQPALRAAVATRAGRDLDSELDTFTLLRQWKDEFRA